MRKLSRLGPALLKSMPLPAVGDGGKDERGRVLVIGGGLELAGAVALAGVAALRAGAGKLQLATAASVVPTLTVAVPEARVFALPETKAGLLAPKAAAILAEHLEGCDAIMVGPGMMHDNQNLAAKVLAVVQEQAIVLDAGAMAAAECRKPSAGSPLRVLTPHAGEMARLLDVEKAAIEADPVAAAHELSLIHI